MNEHIHEEIRREAIRGDDRPMNLGPLKLIIGLFLAVIVLLMVLPYYWINAEPEPSAVPTYEVLFGDKTDWDLSRPDNKDMRAFVSHWDPFIKQTSNRIAVYGCKSERSCQAKAIYYFVRDNINYIGESDEYFQTPQETLYTRGGDCDDHSILLATMLNAIGIPTRFTFVPGHVYIEARLDEDPIRNRAWVPLDATCKNCDFGAITYSVSNKEKYYLQ